MPLTLSLKLSLTLSFDVLDVFLEFLENFFFSIIINLTAILAKMKQILMIKLPTMIPSMNQPKEYLFSTLLS